MKHSAKTQLWCQIIRTGISAHLLINALARCSVLYASVFSFFSVTWPTIVTGSFTSVFCLDIKKSFLCERKSWPARGKTHCKEHALQYWTPETISLWLHFRDDRNCISFAERYRRNNQGPVRLSHKKALLHRLLRNMSSEPQSRGMKARTENLQK